MWTIPKILRKKSVRKLKRYLINELQQNPVFSLR